MKHHPEQLADEIYMGNATFPNRTDWRTNRYGVVALKPNGERLDGKVLGLTSCKPWFIKASEVQAKIDQLKYELDNQPCSWDSNKRETIKLYQEMIDKRTIL